MNSGLVISQSVNNSTATDIHSHAFLDKNSWEYLRLWKFILLNISFSKSQEVSIWFGKYLGGYCSLNNMKDFALALNKLFGKSIRGSDRLQLMRFEDVGCILLSCTKKLESAKYGLGVLKNSL